MSGRGKSSKSVALIDAAHDILAGIRPATVRAVCYQLFNRKLIADMSRLSTARVSRLLTDAREDGTIPWEWFVDETREVEAIATWENPAEYQAAVIRSYRRDRWASQPQRVEVWSEKGTVRGTLKPVLDRYAVPFRVMHGFGSATAVHDAAEASWVGAGPLRVLYVGDWDPSGLRMSEEDLPGRMLRYGGLARIERVALDAGDVVSPELRASAFSVEEKLSDSRYRWFRERFGRWCWELDALSPVVLRERIERAIAGRIVDGAAWNRAAAVEEAELASLKERSSEPGRRRPHERRVFRDRIQNTRSESRMNGITAYFTDRLARRWSTVKGTAALRALIVAGCREAWLIERERAYWPRLKAVLGQGVLMAVS